MDWFREHLWETWLGLTIVLGVLEMLSFDLVLLMLAAGAAVGMVLAMAGLPFEVQAIAAVATSVATLALIRPAVLKRLHKGPDLVLGHHTLLGTKAVVTQDITALEVGRIKAGGEEWSARPYDEVSSFSVGEPVEIITIKGATAYVLPIAQLEA